MNALPLSRDDLRLLADVGFLAAHAGEAAAARQIFEALLVLRPDSLLPHLGKALAEQAAGRLEEAVRWLRDEALPRHPADPELLVFFGLALVQAGWASQAIEPLQRALRALDAEHPGARLARLLWQQVVGTSGWQTSVGARVDAVPN